MAKFWNPTASLSTFGVQQLTRGLNICALTWDGDDPVFSEPLRRDESETS